MVRQNNHEDHNQDYNDDSARRRSVTAAGASLLARQDDTGTSDCLTKRQIRFDSGDVGLVDQH